MIPNQISICIRASFVLACSIVFEAPNAFPLEPAAQCGHASVLLKAIILGLFPVVSPLYFLVTGHGFTSCGHREQHILKTLYLLFTHRFLVLSN
jgi:hypothetical protein